MRKSDAFALAAMAAAAGFLFARYPEEVMAIVEAMTRSGEGSNSREPPPPPPASPKRGRWHRRHRGTEATVPRTADQEPGDRTEPTPDSPPPRRSRKGRGPPR